MDRLGDPKHQLGTPFGLAGGTAPTLPVRRMLNLMVTSTYNKSSKLKGEQSELRYSANQLLAAPPPSLTQAASWGWIPDTHLLHLPWFALPMYGLCSGEGLHCQKSF